MDSYPDVYLSTGLVARITRAVEDHAPGAGRVRAAQSSTGSGGDGCGKVRRRNRPRHRNCSKTDNVGQTPGVDRDGRRGWGQTPDPRVAFATDETAARASIEALLKLRPAFHVAGSVTAGNSSQISDGAAAVIVTSAAYARERGLTPLGRFVTFATAGVEPERFGVGPVLAIKKALKLAGLTLDQIDLVELNEAFAVQVLACLKELPIDPDRLNVNGGAIALGHPLGATGAKLTTSLLHEMRRRQSRYGMVTMCVGGGMGAAGIFERM
jgi:acetyl-CoA acyltransferase